MAAPLAGGPQFIAADARGAAVGNAVATSCDPPGGRIPEGEIVPHRNRTRFLGELACVPTGKMPVVPVAPPGWRLPIGEGRNLLRPTLRETAVGECGRNKLRPSRRLGGTPRPTTRSRGKRDPTGGRKDDRIEGPNPT